VPRAEQPRLLGWGIALALALRLVFIVAGTLLLGALHVTFYAFGALLLVTAYKLGRHGDGDVDPASNPVLGLVRRRGVSPTVAVLVVIATTDLMFAVDSIPAIFAVTTNPWIVFAANAFAMLGLRSLYFVLAGMMDRFTYMSVGLSAILAFIGVKMLLVDVWHPPVWLPLAVVAGVLAVAVGLSLRTGAGLQSAGAPSTASR
jgi:tellurite resistance protein TerC